MQQSFIAGRLGQDAKLATTQSGKSVCNFSVAVDQGRGQDKKTNWWRCTIWGRRADALAPHLTKGTSVSVVGQFELGEYDGKPQLNINVNEITLLGRGEPRQQTGDYQSNQSRDFDDEPPPF